MFFALACVLTLSAATRIDDPSESVHKENAEDASP